MKSLYLTRNFHFRDHPFNLKGGYGFYGGHNFLSANFMEKEKKNSVSDMDRKKYHPPPIS